LWHDWLKRHKVVFMLRILTFSTLFPHAGKPNQGIFVENQTRHLARSGFADVRVVAPIGLAPWPLSMAGHYDHSRLLPSEEVRNDLKIYRPRYVSLPKLGWRFNDRTIVRACRPVLQQLRDEGFDFDVIDAQFFWPCGVAAAALAAEFKVPLSIKSRGGDIHYWTGLPSVRKKVVAAARQADGMLAVSASLKQDMVALGFAAEKIRVHYTGIDLAAFVPRDQTEVRTRLEIAPGPMVLSVGALVARKNHDLLIDAVALLPGVQLFIAGQGPDEAALRAQITRLGVDDRVKLLGGIPYAQLPDLYAAADISALCSKSEGLANVWVESMASGAPVVTFNVDGGPEAITTADAGRLIPNNQRTPAAVAAAITDLLKNRAPRDTVRACAQRFSWTNNTATLLEHLTDLVQKKSRL
jgi:teichuronic acid biosynthesis glycosyltransferase TuaC